MTPLPPSLRALYPWQGHHLQVGGGDMHYLDEGPPEAPALLCLHGNPTWSFYYRALVHHFAGRFRVVVPDYIGCGLSDKPQGWSYLLSDHIANVRRLVQHLGLRHIHLVVHDWGGAVGMGLATEQPGLFSRLVVLNTAAFLSADMPRSIALARIPGEESRKAFLSLWRRASPRVRIALLARLDPRVAPEKFSWLVREAPDIDNLEIRRMIGGLLPGSGDAVDLPDLRRWRRKETDPRIRENLDEAIRRHRE